MSNSFLYSEFYPLFVLAPDSFKHVIVTYLNQRHLSMTSDIISLFDDFMFLHRSIKILLNKRIDDLEFINHKCEEFMSCHYEAYIKKFYSLFEV